LFPSSIEGEISTLLGLSERDNLSHRTMDKVEESGNSGCYAPSSGRSGPFRPYSFRYSGKLLSLENSFSSLSQKSAHICKLYVSTKHFHFVPDTRKNQCLPFIRAMHGRRTTACPSLERGTDIYFCKSLRLMLCVKTDVI
jgi:hypothetical protein